MQGKKERTGQFFKTSIYGMSPLREHFENFASKIRIFYYFRAIGISSI